MKDAIINRPRVSITTLCAAYILISHLILPSINNGDDFLFFTRWSMFSKSYGNIVTDISWDNGETFLFRDYQNFSQSGKIDSVNLFYAVTQKNTQAIKRYHLSELQKFCKCSEVQLFSLSGSLHEHFILKNKLQILESISL